MSFLSQLSAAEYELVVSLPYRAGVYVSYADDVDGEGDDAREAGALEAALRAVSDMQKNSGIACEIFIETIRMKSEWSRWQGKAFIIEDDARAAVALVKGRAGIDAARAYGAAIMEVAAAVARAYGEFGQFDEIEKNPGLLKGLVARVASGFSGLTQDDRDHPMNISASEQGALSTLAEALRV